jgi:large subunit ribosomal protein L2
MALKTFKPITPGLRQLVIVDRKDLYKGKPVKTLTEGKSSAGGRNNLGRITVRFRGGGHKQTYRIVDFKRRKLGVPGKVERIEYDPNRTCFIALIRYADDELAYIIAPQRLSVGDEVISNQQVDVKPGNAMALANMPIGTIVHNVEMKIGKGGAMVRAAGTFAQVVGRDQGYVIVRLNSGEQRLIHGQCFATVGAVSNPDHMNASIGKAGRSRWLGRRPHNRGVTMNPVDHPHGGGEGRTSGGRHPVTPWGKPTKGKKTRSNKSTGKFHCDVSSQKQEEGLSHGALDLERSVRRRLSAQESG